MLERPHDAPPCAATPELRRRIWRAAISINEEAKAAGQRAKPLPGVALRVLDWMLWHAPRGAGALFPSAATIARAISAGERSVRRAVAALAAAGLLVVHARYRRHARPVVANGRVLGTLWTGCRTSNAYTWGDPDFRPCQIGVGVSLRSLRHSDEKRDALTGRWLPAPQRDWINAARQTELLRQSAPGHGIASPLLVQARERAMANLLAGRKIGLMGGTAGR